ncbi:hypothetical protein [Streptomyces sp. R41]|uniref:DUF4439 domain-containing protein n=1 Tax=Streptomyces sp. R41 TaxID=3238632 RepID=A0AB39RC55_9ACTN
MRQDLAVVCAVLFPRTVRGGWLGRELAVVRAASLVGTGRGGLLRQDLGVVCAGVFPRIARGGWLGRELAVVRAVSPPGTSGGGGLSRGEVEGREAPLSGADALPASQGGPNGRLWHLPSPSRVGDVHRTSRAGRGCRRTRRAAAVAVLVLLGVTAAPAFAAPGASEERDAQLVYCLDTSHRGDLVAAAVRLGLLKADAAAQDTVRPTGSGGRMTLEKWAERRQDDFGRACSALMAAESDSPGAAAKDTAEDDWFVTLLKSLPLLAAGALITLGGQLSERVSAERRQIKQQLDSGEAAFRTAVREYLAAYERDAHADHTAVLTARDALTGTLAQVAGPGARRSAARRLADELPLARPLPDARDGAFLGTHARAQEAQGVRQTVDGRLRIVPDLNGRALYWRWRTLREHPAPATPGAAA